MNDADDPILNDVLDNDGFEEPFDPLMNFEGRCRLCGCTDEEACADGCFWAEPDLCSVCAKGKAE